MSPADIIESQVFSVSDATSLINGILQPLSLTIEGEISGFKINQGKFVFFDIKDELAVLNCFMMVHQLPNPLEDGVRVRLVGVPKIHAASGRFSLTVKSVELIGEGALQKAFEALKAKLESETLFDLKWKKQLPMFPVTIGLITSKTGDALQDILRIMRNRAGGLKIYLVPVAVQGQSAVSELISAIQHFNSHLPVDVVIIARGGGSLEDLQAFNSEPVARAIFASGLPIVTGVGHEPNVTLADLVADVRAATPTNAAEIVTPNFAELEKQLKHDRSRLDSAIKKLLINAIHSLEVTRHRLSNAFKKPEILIKQLSDRLKFNVQRKISIMAINNNNLTSIHQQISRALATRVELLKFGLNQFNSLLFAFDPQRVLDRGYAIATKSDGSIIKSTQNVTINDIISVSFSQGSILTEVQKINHERK